MLIQYVQPICQMAMLTDEGVILFNLHHKVAKALRIYFVSSGLRGKKCIPAISWQYIVKLVRKARVFTTPVPGRDALRRREGLKKQRKSALISV
jgi:hypothetical protein